LAFISYDLRCDIQERIEYEGIFYLPSPLFGLSWHAKATKTACTCCDGILW